MGIYLGTNKVDRIGPNDGFMTNGRLIATKNYEFKLSDTNYSSLTPSTTDQSLTLPATDYSLASTSVTCYRIGSDYDGTVITRKQRGYLVMFECQIEFVYSSTVSGTIHGIRYGFSKDYQNYNYHNSVNAQTGKLSDSIGSSMTYTSSKGVILYQQADNSYALTTGSSGIYTSTTPAGFNTDYIDLKLSSFSVKASDSYFPVAALTAIDPSNTKIKCTWYVYEGDETIADREYDRAYTLAANQ